MRYRSLEKGFTTYEVLIAIAIIGLISLALSSIMNVLISSQRDVSSQTGRDSLRSSLLSIFDHPQLCKTALASTKFVKSQAVAPGQGLPLINFPIDGGASIINSYNPLNYPAGKPTPVPIPITRYSIAYQYLLFQNATNLGADPDTPGNNLWEGTVSMSISKLPAPNMPVVLGGNNMPVQTVGTVVFSVNNLTNQITGCQSVQTVADDCANYGGVVNPSPPPACVVNAPCKKGQIFAGTDNNGNAICETLPTNCKSGYGLAPNANGVLVCTKI